MTDIDQCDASIVKARHHILTRTLAGLPARTVARVIGDPAVGKAVAHMNRMAESGDLPATQAAAQAWNRAIKVAITAAPAVVQPVPLVGAQCPDGQAHTWLRRGEHPRLCAHCNAVELVHEQERGR